MTTSFRCSYAVVSRKARFSSWETYEGVAIGGFTGEVATLYVRPIGDGAIIAGGSTLVGHSLENLTGKESRSTGEVLLNTGRDSVIGVAVVFCL